MKSLTSRHADMYFGMSAVPVTGKKYCITGDYMTTFDLDGSCRSGDCKVSHMMWLASVIG